ncbi:B3 domain-containing protein At1g49475-like [Papaver somniferum]|uniref:B3 domain-containing protein At1g49475-like n=1 Tax=Papaver somniferum TaxID=3469 RepID=UPI000E6FEF12|nr:B3 domain-containing protein At1g49475-like [Papaver somniferum]
MGETTEWSSLREEQRPKFSIIIHNAIIQNGSFELPTQFVKRIEKDLVDDSIAILRVSNGGEWRIKMTRVSDVNNGGGGVWFRTGIVKFIDYYSMSPGHFLVFRYDGNLQFHVLIFDMTGNEIDYHLYAGNDPSEHFNDIDNSYNIESFKTKEDVHYVEISSGSPTDTDESAKDDVAKKPSCSSKNNRSKSPNTKDYVVRADAIVGGFTSRYPFFRVIMQISYLKHCYMPIPFGIGRMYFSDDVTEFKVEASDGRLWKIGVVRSKTGDMRFCKGVSTLVKKNGLNLKLGDVLIFEIVEKRCLKVNVFSY